MQRPAAARRLRLVMPHIRNVPSFIQADIDALRSRHDVVLVPCRSLAQIARSVTAAWRSDAVVCWFGSTRYLPLTAAARLLGRRVVIISGGYDVAAMPELDYGNMHHRVSRVLGRALFRLANAVASISASAAAEALANAGVAPDRLRVIYLALDPAPGAPTPAAGAKQRLVLTVAHADRSAIRRKGVLTTLRVARLLPDVPFVVAGPVDAETRLILEAEAGPNVRIEGAVSAARLNELFSLARVYVQPSRHEGFGYSVAEAMLHNCVPVVSRCYALPEVVGNAGLYVDDLDDLQGWAEAVRRALDPPRLAEDPRRRISERFSLEQRRQQLLDLLDDVCRPPA